jgi:hypothetical protein
MFLARTAEPFHYYRPGLRAFAICLLAMGFLQAAGQNPAAQKWRQMNELLKKLSARYDKVGYNSENRIMIMKGDYYGFVTYRAMRLFPLRMIM